MVIKTVHVEAGTAVIFDGVGLEIRALINTWDDDDGKPREQPTVTIYTAGLDARFTYDERDRAQPGGMPILAVHVNDADVFDDEGAGDRVAGRA